MRRFVEISNIRYTSSIDEPFEKVSGQGVQFGAMCVGDLLNSRIVKNKAQVVFSFLLIIMEK